MNSPGRKKYQKLLDAIKDRPALHLATPAGIKTSGRSEPPKRDIKNMVPEEIIAYAYLELSKRIPDIKEW